MRQSEKGFTTLELMVAISIMSLIGLAATMTIFQVISVTGRTNSHLTAIRQVQNSGHWIGRDAQMAENIVTDNMSGTDFMLISWTEWDYDAEDEVYHQVTYFFDGLTGGIGKLKRNHWSSAGVNADILVAECISYDPDDPANTSNVSYQKPVLTLKLTALYGDASETREYRIGRRPTT